MSVRRVKFKPIKTAGCTECQKEWSNPETCQRNAREHTQRTGHTTWVNIDRDYEYRRDKQ